MAAFFAPMSPSNCLRRVLLGSAATFLALAGTGLPAQAQKTATAKPDHVLWRNQRGQTNTVVGTVTENSLANVAIDTGTSQRKLDALAVERVEFGDVPQSYADAETYLARGDIDNAAASFTLAAGDAAARPVVRARARLSAAQAWLRRGASDRSALDKAKKDCEQFLAEFAGNREAPEARLLLGRLQRLSGDSKTAAETYLALYKEVAAGTPGYPPRLSFQAGLRTGEAYLATKDAAKARELFLGLDAALGAALAALGDNDPLRPLFTSLQSEARLGEGYCLLASGSLSQAKTFFQSQVTAAEKQAARRFGARLGLGEALLAEGNARAAELEFAQVSAIDHTDQDRTARALVGLAESALALNARNDAKLWLETVRTQHGDTPAALRAQELLQKL
jgi:TolA-binding protein